jgi:hypothetical protein
MAKDKPYLSSEMVPEQDRAITVKQLKIIWS